MNERIKELAEQAGIKFVPFIVDGEEYDFDEVEVEDSDMLEKFAELIVKECANELIRWKDEPFPYDPEFGARLINEHFGIEEEYLAK